MSLYIDMQVAGGTDILSAARDATAVADQLRCTVRFEFNGVQCMARPGDEPKSLAEAWEAIFHKRTTTTIAVGRSTNTAKERAA